MKKCKDDPASMVFISGFIGQENSLLSRQAAEIARDLPHNAVPATEYYDIALALGNSNDLQAEKEFLKLAEDNAKDFNTEISALRTTAALQFIMGQLDSGRVEYQRP